MTAVHYYQCCTSAASNQYIHLCGIFRISNRGSESCTGGSCVVYPEPIESKSQDKLKTVVGHYQSAQNVMDEVMNLLFVNMCMLLPSKMCCGVSILMAAKTSLALYTSHTSHKVSIIQFALFSIAMEEVNAINAKKNTDTIFQLNYIYQFQNGLKLSSRCSFLNGYNFFNFTSETLIFFFCFCLLDLFS